MIASPIPMQSINPTVEKTTPAAKKGAPRSIRERSGNFRSSVSQCSRCRLNPVPNLELQAQEVLGRGELTEFVVKAQQGVSERAARQQRGQRYRAPVYLLGQTA